MLQQLKQASTVCSFVGEAREARDEASDSNL